jgi:cysteinyl-tRNA synthetase
MSDDFNTAKTLAVLFEMASRINDLQAGNTNLSQIGAETFDHFQKTFIGFMEDVLGLKEEPGQNEKLLDQVIHVLIDLRKRARQDRNYALSDKIRDDLKHVGVQLKDGKDGEISYSIET